ncbi:MAG: type II toxin-antitoxin system VapC family toxin [bacterium]
MVDIDRQQLRAATQLRAVHGLRTPDALQLAAGLARRATTMITNDRRLPGIPGAGGLAARRARLGTIDPGRWTQPRGPGPAIPPKPRAHLQSFAARSLRLPSRPRNPSISHISIALSK